MISWGVQPIYWEHWAGLGCRKSRAASTKWAEIAEEPITVMANPQVLADWQ